MRPDLLREYLTFYQDLGVTSLYVRRPVAAPAQELSSPGVAAARGEAGGRGEAVPAAAPAPPLVEPEEEVVGSIPIQLPGLAPAGDTLLKIIEDMGDCKRCRLHTGRNKIVFGAGNDQAKLVFVGEGPGQDED